MTVELTGAISRSTTSFESLARESRSRSPTRPSAACASAGRRRARPAGRNADVRRDDRRRHASRRKGGPKDARAFNRSAIFGHLVGLGEPAPDEVVRASLLRLANALAAGHQGGRPEVADALIEALNAGEALVVRSLGTVGQADLAQNADLAHGALQDVQLEAGEAIALLMSNAFSTGQSALAIADARSLLDWIDAAAALDFEAFRANVGALHSEVAAARPYQGIGETLTRMHDLLDGSALWEPGAARFLQDPLTFRCVPQVHGAARDALRFVQEQLAIELNAHQGNPLSCWTSNGSSRSGTSTRNRSRPHSTSPHRARARAHGRRRTNAEAS